MRLAVLAPVQSSLYSRLITFLAAQEPDLQVTVIIVRTPWTLARVRGELRRDGIWLVRKAVAKMLLGEQAYRSEDPETIIAYARQVDLPPGTLKTLARTFGIPLVTVPDHNAPAALRALRSAAPDLIVFTGGGLLRKEVLAAARIGVMNCHSGILPCYRGMGVVEWPILEADGELPKIGLSLHLMDAGVDTGPILCQRRLALRPGDTFASIYTRLEPHMVELILKGLRGLRDGTIAPEPQNIDDGRQYFVLHPRLLAEAQRRLYNITSAI